MAAMRVLAGVAFTPTTFACAGGHRRPSNLETLLATIPPYWEAGRKADLQPHGRPEHRRRPRHPARRLAIYKADQIVRRC